MMQNQAPDLVCLSEFTSLCKLTLKMLEKCSLLQYFWSSESQVGKKIRICICILCHKCTRVLILENKILHIGSITIFRIKTTSKTVKFICNDNIYCGFSREAMNKCSEL